MKGALLCRSLGRSESTGCDGSSPKNHDMVSRARPTDRAPTPRYHGAACRHVMHDLLDHERCDGLETGARAQGHVERRNPLVREVFDHRRSVGGTRRSLVAEHAGHGG